ncbi:hypothetical protein RJ639_031485 [Escallonia herrerae]|uniref:F-box/LRR-repeat protein 17 n=1 Tax=Escallonia herrerae TaxID=1293975 RepID=A0AA88WYX9_9ASTE|nr:hypothetical protein RJ639_031485 [Escallonia herrerae]
MHNHQPHPVTPGGAAPISDLQLKRGKTRGSYNCGRCGLPKKGHSCHLPRPSRAAAAPTPPDSTSSAASELASPLSAVRPAPTPPPRQPHSQLRRALSFDEVDVKSSQESDDEDEEYDEDYYGLPERESGIDDVDATMLACIAFSCPNLESVEILTADTSVNRVTGDELGRFVADKRRLTNLKMEGCSNLGGFNLSSSSLSTLWLSDLHSLSKMVFNCPNLVEISLDFSRQETDNTDLTAMVDGLGRNCLKLQNIHIASLRLSHAVVLALTAADLRGLRLLSLVLGSEITDASVAAIASSYSNLELLDLSGSSISDSGIGMICNVFPETLSRLLLALCPNITSSGIQFATAQLPRLELMDCGMTLCDFSEEYPTSDKNSDLMLQKAQDSKLHLMYQKLIIKHGRLKKLSLWGCSGLDVRFYSLSNTDILLACISRRGPEHASFYLQALCLNCPDLRDLNLNSCRNLHPEKLLLQCPSLESVHASGCQATLVETIQNQLCSDFSAVENHFPFKRLPDGSKRVRVPHHLSQQVNILKFFIFKLSSCKYQRDFGNNNIISNYIICY